MYSPITPSGALASLCRNVGLAAGSGRSSGQRLNVGFPVPRRILQGAQGFPGVSLGSLGFSGSLRAPRVHAFSLAA